MGQKEPIAPRPKGLGATGPEGLEPKYHSHTYSIK